MKQFSILISIFLFFIAINVHAQIDDNSVMGLPTATLAEITAVVPANPGAVAYATDTNKIYKFDGTAWNEVANNNLPKVYLGFFIITASGPQTISGLPFQPSQISFVAHANVETLNLNSDNGVGNNSNTIANAFGTSNGFARDDNGTLVQQSIYVGGSGTSINDISRFASSSNCIGIRYSNQNGDELGLTTAELASFNVDGFTVNVNNFADGLVVLYQAYD